MDSAAQDITMLLGRLQQDGKQVYDQLLPLVYEKLRRIADSKLRLERNDHTLQATALVHEAYLKLVDQVQAGSNRECSF